MLNNLAVRNLRHIALQWSSSRNRFDELVTAVDVNFHGGFAHNNLLTNVEFHLPETHPWPNVYRTPPDAHWAPPDGPNNQVFEKALEDEEATPAGVNDGPGDA
jgi:glycosyltransferase Alg8